MSRANAGNTLRKWAAKQQTDLIKNQEFRPRAVAGSFYVDIENGLR